MREELLNYYERELTFIRQMGAQFAETVGHPEWVTDPVYARDNWLTITDTHIRPAVEAWAKDKSKRDVCFLLAKAGIACAPVNKR